MNEHVIINASDRFAKKAPPPPETSGWRTALKTLPFVSSEWKNKYWPESMWTDVPTDDPPADIERGERFATLTLAAMERDDGRELAVIFETMIEDCARRRAKGGKGSRQLPWAIYGYLKVLGNFIASQSGRSGPAA